MKQLQKYYAKMPKFIKFPIEYLYGVTPNAIKYGNIYRKTKKFLSKSQWWSSQEHLEYQTKQMQSLLIHAYEHVPYYKRIFDERGFSPYTFKKLNEIEVLPLLDKDTIEKNFEDLLADNFNVNKIMLNTTGGTSGHQLRFYTEKNYRQIEVPFVELIWERVGYSSKSKIATLRNTIFKNSTPYMYDWKNRRLVLDNFHLTDENIKKILDKLCTDKIEYIHTYPSAILTICNYIKRTDYKMLHTLKAVLATSENIYPGQKELVEEVLNCRFFTFYGHSERACIAGWCEHSEFYHIQSEYGYIELFDEKEQAIKEPNINGEIICTGFSNYAMPFIRYRTGDYASYKSGSCECRRNYKLLNNIEGRWLQEMLVCKDGHKISIAALNMHSDVFKNVKDYQIYQDKIGECILRIVKSEHYKEEDDERNIINEFSKKLGSAIKLTVNYVDDIEKTKRGKYKYLIQKL